MVGVAENSDTWLRRFHPVPGSTVRLVCLPHAGGSASFFFPVSKALAPSVEVLSVQYPGRQDRRSEPPIDDIGVLADHVCRALATYTDKPLALFGHSMGAIVAFETTRRLEARGVKPVRLLASGRRAPSSRYGENIHRRDDDGIAAELRALSGTEQQLLADEDFLRMILPAVRSDYRANETYRGAPGATTRCPITAFVGDSDPKVTVDEAHTWREHTTGAFDLKVFPGGHFYLTDWPHPVVREIADSLDHAE
jgi:surfactin synthase thioesterase subunit